MSTTFTPGPWVECSQPTGALHAVRAPSKYYSLGAVICDVGFGGSREINNANARLIAAAPELLDALNTMLEYTAELNANQGISDDHPAVNQASAAIAKATGGAA